MSEPVTAEQIPRDGWRHLLVMLAMIVVGFLGQPDQAAAAGIQTFYYISPGYTLGACGPGISPPCLTSGNITGTFTFKNVTPGFSGNLSQFDIATYTTNGAGVGSLNQSNFTTAITVNVTNGVATSGGFSMATSSPPTYPFVGIVASVSGGGSATITDGVTYQAIGAVPTTEVGTWFSGKALGSPCARPGAASCGEPIDLGSGNVFDQVTDYETVGQNKLSLIRYYNSMATPDTSAVSLGQNWRTNYDRYLHVINPAAIYGVVAERPDGSSVNFSSSAGTYTPDTDVDLKLVNTSGSTWTLTDQNDTVETYTVTAGLGKLTSITQRNKYTQALTYGSGQLAFVSDSYSRKLTFGYASGLLTTVSTPEFTSGLTYGYVAFVSAGTHALQTVTYATSPSTHQTYAYGDSDFPYAMTGITDENGNNYATWGYDSVGRGILSQLSGGVNYTSVYYNDANRTRVVKGPLGIFETYKFASLQGVPKVIEIDRAANSPVVAASETMAYDSNGYRSSLNDWNGNNTSWVNNSHGKPTQIAFASNTTNKQITNITYDFWFPHLPHTIASNGLTSNFGYDSAGNQLTRTDKDTTTTTSPYVTTGQTRTTTSTWNTTGQKLSVQLPRTDVTAKTSFGYTGGTLTSITDALSHVWTVNTATAGGRWTKITDPNGVQTTFAYKAVREWLTSSVLLTSAGSLTSSTNFDSAGELTKTTLPDNSYLSYGYDNAHRVTSITNILGEIQALTLDSAGNETQRLWKNASGITVRKHTATFDALGEKLTDVGGQSQSTSFRRGYHPLRQQ
jgi:YD repeat-containing protein